MKLPDFIIAGCMKAGTTGMFMNLSKHPNITMSGIFGPLSERQTQGTGTEMHYWSKLRKEGRDLDWYKSKFNGEVSGEKSPSYWIHMGALRQIFKHNPDTKFIVCVRHPVERAHSHYMMNRLRTSSKAPFDPKHVKPVHVGLGKYYEKLNKCMLKIIPRENIHIVVSDWMKTNTTEEMMKVHKFLGINEIYIPTKEIIWRKLKVSLYDISQDKDSYVIWSGHSKKKIDPKVREHYLEVYRPHNERLFNFLGYKIPEWSK